MQKTSLPRPARQTGPSRITDNAVHFAAASRSLMFNQLVASFSLPVPAES
jgi:hypothetical protein